MHGSQLAALDVLGDLEGVRLQIIPRAVRQMLLFELSDDSKFDNLKKLRFISGDSRQIYIVENSQITRINRRGCLFLTDSTDNQKAVNIKMPTLLKAMRQLNKFYNE